MCLCEMQQKDALVRNVSLVQVYVEKNIGKAVQRNAKRILCEQPHKGHSCLNRRSCQIAVLLDARHSCIIQF